MWNISISEHPYVFAGIFGPRSVTDDSIQTQGFVTEVLGEALYDPMATFPSEEHPEERSFWHRHDITAKLFKSTSLLPSQCSQRTSLNSISYSLKMIGKTTPAVSLTLVTSLIPIHIANNELCEFHKSPFFPFILSLRP
jgi:hypothetical protein